MKLYNVISNEIFFKRILINPAINASLDYSDYDEFNESNSYWADIFSDMFYYEDKENWNLNYVVSFPFKRSIGELGSNEIAFEFNLPENDIIYFNYPCAFGYVHYVDTLISNADKGNVEEMQRLYKNNKDFVDNIYDYLLKDVPVEDRCAIVQKIPAYSISKIYATRNNKLAKYMVESSKNLKRTFPIVFVDKMMNTTKNPTPSNNSFDK